ncbi:MAG: EAL domain-containing protein [Gammaproteobacteria bacterium]|nr:EAL domain-containing protein [Gammaproteobacteria bacterium]
MKLGPLSNPWLAHSEANLPANQELKERIRLEQVALLYRNSMTGFMVSIAAGGLMVFALRTQVPVVNLLLWYGLLLLVTALRYSFTQRYQASKPALRQSRDWEKLFLLGAAGAGLVWGLSIIVLFPADSVAHQFLVALVLSAMVGGAVAVFSARKTVYLAFAFTIMIPVVLRFLYENDAVHTALAIMAIIYLIGMIVTARNTEQVIRIALALRFDNQELAEQVSRRKRTEIALRNSEERLRDFAESAADFFWELDAELRLIDISERFHEITELQREQVIGQNIEQLVRSYCSDLDVVEKYIKRLNEKDVIEHLELIWKITESTSRTLLFSGKPIFNNRGEFLGYRGVGRDVTKERHIAQLMNHQAKHDALTGLVNRREFMHRLENALVHCKRDGASYVLCYLDLDQFKIVNDTVGHGAGDALLKELAGILCSRLRTRDTLSRVGGDEFALMLENCQLDSGIQIAESLLAVLADFRFQWEGREFRVGASIGVVPISSESETALKLLTQADLACYTAKDLGRNRIYTYDSEDRELSRTENQMALVSKLQMALMNDQFVLYRQPICSLKDGHIEHYEILLRLKDSTNKILSPRNFIPAAERYGLMKEIDRWVIKHALSAYAHQYTNSSTARFSINLSGNSLNDDGLLQWVLKLFKHFKVSPDRICFEITETAAIRNLNQAKQLINALRTEGCRFALDDFGSGLSSFAYIKYLPVDYLKIDGSFVVDMGQEASANAMVSAINEMGHVLGIQTVAEHVENSTTLEAMRDIGVDHVQGFAMGEPTPLPMPY